ncbi:MAG: hypothetical protein ACPL1K_06850 [Candidatus Kryptoniota bacterium]
MLVRCFTNRVLTLTAILIALTPFYNGCTHASSNGHIVARAGRNQLTMDEVAKHVDTTSAYAVRNFVTRWVDEQLLYQKAVREGVENSPDYRSSVSNYSRQLAIALYLQKRIYSTPSKVTSEQIASFYSAHKEEFRASDKLLLVNMASFDKRSTAVAFRNAILSTGSWASAFSLLPQYSILSKNDSIFINENNSNSEIWRVVESLPVGRPSFPIQVDSVSFVIQVLKKIMAGDQLPISYVKPLIRERLTIEHRKQEYVKILDSLKSAGDFSIDPSIAIKDTNDKE